MSQNGITLPTSGTLAGLTAVEAINAAHEDLAGFFSGAAAPSAPIAYQYWADTASGYLKQRNGANTAWNSVAKLDQDALAALQSQLYTAFTTAGTAPAYTLAPTPAIAAYAANQRFRVKFNAAGTTGSNTLNVSGKGAVSLKQYDSNGNKVAAVVAAGQLVDVEFDGTDWVLIDPLPSPSVGFKNGIINGCCRVQQRANATLSATPQYVVDRFMTYVSGGTGVSGTVGQALASLMRSGYAIFVSGASWATGSLIHKTRLEAKDTKKYNGKTVTISAMVTHDFGSTTNFNILLAKATAADNFTGTTQIGSIATTAVPTATGVRITGTFTLGSTDGDNGLEIQISSASVTVANKNAYVGDIQLQEGSAFDAMEVRPFESELALCQRYYEKSYPLATVPGTAIDAGCVGARQAGVNLAYSIVFKGAKRTTPTMTYYSPITGSSGVWRDRNANADLTVSVGSATSAADENQATTTVTATNGNLVNGHWVANAEL